MSEKTFTETEWTKEIQLKIVSPLFFAANRSRNMNLDILEAGDVLQHDNGTFLLLIEKLPNSDKWLTQPLMIEPK